MSDEQKLIDREARLIAYDGKDRIVHFTDYLTMKAEESKKFRPFFSGFTSFDEKLGGLCTGEVTIITGHTGQGKTLFAESLIRNMTRQDDPVKSCVFSYEVSPHVVLEKYSDDALAPLYAPLELTAMNTDWLSDKILEAKLKYDCRIFVLDHLHYLVDMAIKQNMSLNIGAFMRRLKFEVANQLNVAILLLAHQDKGDKTADASLEGIRDSTFISQEADNVIVVSRRKDYTDGELRGLGETAAQKIRERMTPITGEADLFHDGFALVQIAKSRRKGTFRWSKVFQKVGNFLEEV